MSSAELYDPATGQWTATGGMNDARRFHTATLLQSGEVLVAAGFNGAEPRGGRYLSSAELYDPVSGQWTETGDIGFPRDRHTATLLPSGEVLLAGGYRHRLRSLFSRCATL